MNSNKDIMQYNVNKMTCISVRLYEAFWKLIDIIKCFGYNDQFAIQQVSDLIMQWNLEQNGLAIIVDLLMDITLQVSETHLNVWKKFHLDKAQMEALARARAHQARELVAPHQQVEGEHECDQSGLLVDACIMQRRICFQQMMHLSEILFAILKENGGAAHGDQRSREPDLAGCASSLRSERVQTPQKNNSEYMTALFDNFCKSVELAATFAT